jgi:trimethylamine:corrinoid methyltransferase-like protein
VIPMGARPEDGEARTMTFYSPLSERDLRRVHAAALRVLDETGVRVESEEILGLLGDSGGRVDLGASRVRFSPTWVERFIEESERYDWSTHRMRLGTWAGVYASAYLDPETDELRPFTEETFADYVRMGNALEPIDSVSNLGIPFSVDGWGADGEAVRLEVWLASLGNGAVFGALSVHRRNVCAPSG